MGFPGGSDGKESAFNTGDPGLIFGWGRSPGEGETTHSSILAWKVPLTEEPLKIEAFEKTDETLIWPSFSFIIYVKIKETSPDVCSCQEKES